MEANPTSLPIIYFNDVPNFGDLLSPLLLSLLTGKAARPITSTPDTPKNFVKETNFLLIGSILSRVQDSSVVWGWGHLEQNTGINFLTKLVIWLYEVH